MFDPDARHRSTDVGADELTPGTDGARGVDDGRVRGHRGEHGHDAGHDAGHDHAHDDHAHDDHAHDDHAHDDHAHDGHGHSHGGVDASILDSAEAMRTLKLSLLILALTTALQGAVVVLSGSIALLADAVHNAGDALTAIPLAAAFLLGRRLPTRRLTYGWGRAEDFAGLSVIAIILFSAVFAGYEAIDRLIHPSTPGYLVATAIAGAIGFVGNEWVAIYRIRSGRRIGSAALEADGYHARVDGFTSLAVVVGAAGVALGFRRADPIIGLLISIAIIGIVWRSAKEIGLRALDGVETSVIDALHTQAAQVDEVTDVEEIRARWLGHSIRAELAVAVHGEQSVHDADRVAAAVRQRLVDNVEHVGEAIVRVTAAAPRAVRPQRS